MQSGIISCDCVAQISIRFLINGGMNKGMLKRSVLCGCCCRFCDLVFQGPLSVQEDWIKHLQRHIMNTGVPNTGLSMVEVSMQPRDPSNPRPDQDGPSTGPHHAAS